MILMGFFGAFHGGNWGSFWGDEIVLPGSGHAARQHPTPDITSSSGHAAKSHPADTTHTSGHVAKTHPPNITNQSGHTRKT